MENNKVYRDIIRDIYPVVACPMPSLEKLCLRTFRDWYIKASMDHSPKFVNFHSPFDRV